MPLFMPDEELARLASDAASVVAKRADEYIRKLYAELEQKYLSLSQAQKIQLHLKSIEKDVEVERMKTEMSELHKSKRQLMELLEQKDATISEKNSIIKTIKSYLDKMMSEELCTAEEEIDKLRGEIESSKSHMLQYKSIAQVNETALKQMESAHENFRQEAEKKQRSLEAEIVALTERVSELANY